MNIDPTAIKYLIHSNVTAEGVIDKSDVIGAIFGQTEGLLGDELDLRDLQKSGRMGRIEVDVESKKGKSNGSVIIPSSLDQVETSILAAALETIERVGPCKASFAVEKVEDVRMAKRDLIVNRAKELLKSIMTTSNTAGGDLSDSVRQAVQVEEIISYGKFNSPAGPNVETSDAIVVVEGRSDILNLLKYGIKNTVAVQGTNINTEIQTLTRERVVTAFVDGDRGGELIVRELLQVAEVDFVARAPPNTEVEELTQKQIMKALRNKLPIEQYIEMYGIKIEALGNDNDLGNKGNDKPLKKAIKNNGPTKSPRQRPQPQTPRSYNNKPQPQSKPLPNPQPKPQPYNRPPQQAKPQPQSKPLPSPPPKPQPKKSQELSPKMKDIKAKLGDLLKERKGLLLDKNGKVLEEVQVGELADTLKTTKENIDSVIFGGFVTQRLVDIASEKGIKTLAGLKESNVSKRPENIEIITKDKLE